MKKMGFKKSGQSLLFRDGSGYVNFAYVPSKMVHNNTKDKELLFLSFSSSLPSPSLLSLKEACGDAKYD